jgi:hypothetical protein
MPCIVEDLQGAMQMLTERRCLSRSRRRAQAGCRRKTDGY